MSKCFACQDIGKVPHIPGFTGQPYKAKGFSVRRNDQVKQLESLFMLNSRKEYWNCVCIECYDITWFNFCGRMETKDEIGECF